MEKCRFKIPTRDLATFAHTHMRLLIDRTPIDCLDEIQTVGLGKNGPRGCYVILYVKINIRRQHREGRTNLE